MITRISFSIDDTKWPKLHLAGVREGTTGAKTAFENNVQYDLAGSQFECDVQNQLRAACMELVQRRKAQQ